MTTTPRVTAADRTTTVGVAPAPAAARTRASGVKRVAAPPGIAHETTGRSRSRPRDAQPGRTRKASRRAIAAIAATLLALTGSLVASSSAQAAGYRHLKSVRYGTCVTNLGDPIEGFYMLGCSRKPTADVNWSVTLDGYYNNHPLWLLHRQGYSCLSVLFESSGDIPQMSCSAKGSADVWEVFTASGHYVLKSFGAYQSRSRHECLRFDGGPRLGGCSLTSSTDMIYK